MPVEAAPSRDAAPSRAAASAPIKKRDEVLEAVTSGAFSLKDNERDSLRNRSTPLCGSPVRSLYTLLILPLALTRIVLFIVVFTSTGCTAALAACLPARSCGRRCLLAVAMRGIRAGLFCLGYHYIKQVGKPSPQAKIVCANHVSFVETFYLTSILTPCGADSACNIELQGDVIVTKTSPRRRRCGRTRVHAPRDRDGVRATQVWQKLRQQAYPWSLPF